MKAREVVDMALLHGWLQVADYGALLGLLTQARSYLWQNHVLIAP